MRIFSGPGDLPPLRKGSAVAIGNFDGLHLGHQRILARLSRTAGRKNLFSLVLTFDLHPGRALKKPDVLLIQTLSQRIEALGRSGVRGVLVASFDKNLSSLSGRAFAERFLKDDLRAREVVVGENFRFGKDRLSDIRDLRSFGREFGFGVSSVPPVREGDVVISSSLIRRLLLEGRVEKAGKLLGRPYEIEGAIVAGRSRGLELGFPTANLKTSNEILPRGVFFSLSVLGAQVYPSLSNIGFQPTFGAGPLSVETFILNCRRKLYGKSMKLRLLKKIRAEKAFESPEALSRRLAVDVGKAVEFFKTWRS